MNPSGLLAVGVGAALGAWLRWGFGHWFNPVFSQIPLGTLVANLTGGFLIGVLAELIGRHAGLPPELRLFLITGFLGGLTTFSTFSAEAVALLERAQYGWAGALIALHVVGSVSATIAGIAWVRAIH